MNLKFLIKRNYKMITPCCQKSNKDGKFANYIGLHNSFGYCHSCGIAKLPPSQYEDENGEKFEWCKVESKFIPSLFNLSDTAVRQLADNSIIYSKTTKDNIAIDKKYIDNQVVNYSLKVKQQNNLLQYIGKTYGQENKEFVRHLYKLGTSKDGGIIFWCINKDQKVQKAKVSYYNKNGKRTSKFKVPYKNDDGYYSCLFGEHLLFKNNNPIILVESEKTAVVCAIHFPYYTWLSYGGINGLTDNKIKVLRGRSITLIPDISSKAVNIMHSKLPFFKFLDIKASIWDMRNGLSDEELEEKGLYNCDLEDFF